ncbi:MAG TPA: hypothetical protein VFW75_06105 [Acetobacteraceae bacterium]|nr:hypothetical protein [Acetobacteraceae bacterium]
MSTTSTTTTTRYAVIRRDEDGGGEHRLGVIAIDPDGMLALVSHDNDPDDRLPVLVEELNRRPHLNVKEPAGAGAPRFALASRIVERGTPEFMSALTDYLAKYHLIELQAA